MAPPPPPPRDFWYGRYWRFYNRPRAGCGCLYSLILLAFLWLLLSWLFTPMRFWYWW
jgi:hypothetical protein